MREFYGRHGDRVPCGVIHQIDTMHLGRERVIAAHLVRGMIVDPGPASALEHWIDDLEEEPRALLLTHIHLDHAGASGVLVRRWPHLRVYVSEVGAPHLVDPSRLLHERRPPLRRENMDRLWGEVAPIPEANIVALGGGEEVEGFRVEHVPGHASHHLCWLDPEARRRVRRRHGRGAGAAGRAHARADAAAGDRRRGVARLGRPDRGAGARAPAADALRPRRGRRRAARPRARGACGATPSGADAATRGVPRRVRGGGRERAADPTTAAA